ncbi:unnamed protein product [Dicrocoelium dendriticum]|nr:unnamed protein product [Dicrocoelium dendriticum]
MALGFGRLLIGGGKGSKQHEVAHTPAVWVLFSVFASIRSKLAVQNVILRARLIVRSPCRCGRIKKQTSNNWFRVSGIQPFGKDFARPLVENQCCDQAGFDCAVDDLLQEPPLVLPEGNSNSFDSQDISEKSEKSTAKKAVLGKTDEILNNPEFPPPPSPASFQDTDHEEPERVSEARNTCNSAAELPISTAYHSTQADSNLRPETEADYLISGDIAETFATDERVNTEFCVVEDPLIPQDTRENSLEKISSQSSYRDSETAPEVDQGFLENGHLSEESCSSYQLVKSIGDQTPKAAGLAESSGSQQPQQNLRDSKEEIPVEACAEPESTSEQTTQNNLVNQTVETAESLTLDHNFCAESSFDYVSPTETLVSGTTEQGATCTAPYDISMSTTGGISEIASDRMTHEPLNQTSTSAEDMDDEAHEFETDNRTTYDIESNYHDEVAVEDAEELTERGSDIHLGSSFQPGVLEFGIIEEEARPSFKAICEELDKKNVVSHLQQCHSGPFVMNPPIASLRQQDIVVLNPRTGEVLGANQHAAQPIHAAQIDILKATNEDAVTGGMDQHLNGPDDLGQQPGYEMQQNGNTDSSSKGGRGAGASDEGSGNANGGSHPIHSASMERARQTYNMSQCQLAHVTVYLDRALICRRIRPRFKASEITEVLFEHLSPAIDKDSVR